MEVCGQGGDAVVVIFGDDQCVPEVKGGDIKKNQDKIILKKLAAGDFSFDYFTENTIINERHLILLSCFFGRGGIINC